MIKILEYPIANNKEYKLVLFEIFYELDPFDFHVVKVLNFDKNM